MLEFPFCLKIALNTFDLSYIISQDRVMESKMYDFITLTNIYERLELPEAIELFASSCVLSLLFAYGNQISLEKKDKNSPK